jgi:hypothetical protein
VRLPVVPAKAAEIAAPETEAPSTQPVVQIAGPGPGEAAEPSASGAVADRWAPMNQFAPAPASPPPPARATSPAPVEKSAPAALATGTQAFESDQVVEESVPAINGPAPLPRRKPTMTASFKRADPPLPRPRPDGQTAPQSVWTAVPPTDDRYPTE